MSPAAPMSASCPICLNGMAASDALHPIQCPSACQFNFCINCLSALLASSKDDYELASDGNRHVKIRLNCPNCRADISGSIEETIRLRREAIKEELHKVPDSELSAKELQRKYWNEKERSAEKNKRKSPQHHKSSGPLEIDATLFRGLEPAMTEQEQKYVTELMTSGYPDQLCQAAQILSGVADNLRRGNAPSVQNSPRNTRGKACDPPNSAASNTTRTSAALQAANSGTNMRHGYSNAGVRTNRTRDGGDRDNHVTNFQKQMEEEARAKLRRPLPARMPLCVTLSTGEFEKMALDFRKADRVMEPTANDQPKLWLSGLKGLLGGGAGGLRGGASMTFVDDEWDGSVADAFARARIGTGAGNLSHPVVQARVGPKNPMEQMGVKKILAFGEAENKGRQKRRQSPPSGRVLVWTVRGQAGKSGIMRGDVVTHVNGEAFNGDAVQMNALLVQAYEDQGQNGVVMIVVNADECTAEALRLRSHVR